MFKGTKMNNASYIYQEVSIRASKSWSNTLNRLICWITHHKDVTTVKTMSWSQKIEDGDWSNETKEVDLTQCDRCGKIDSQRAKIPFRTNTAVGDISLQTKSNYIDSDSEVVKCTSYYQQTKS